VIHSFPRVDEIRDEMLTGRAPKSNFFFTELQEPMSCRNLRGTIDTITPMNLPSDRRKVKIVLGSPKNSIKGERSARNSSFDSLHRGKSVKNQIMNDFEKSLESRIKKSERMFNATANVLKQTEESRERMRETWARKEEKWSQTIHKVAKQKQVKV